MSDERLRVFVSSKMQELQPEREIVAKVLEDLNLEAWIFERDAGARAQTIEQTFLDEIEKADLYVGLFWKGHGDYTIEEFEHAQALGTDCLIYQKQGPRIESQRAPGLTSFLARINEVESGLTPAWFTSPDQLAALIRADVTRWQTEIVRQRLEGQATRLFFGVPQGPPELVGRSGLVRDLVRRLRTARASIAIDGMPGVGKTALAAYLVQLPAILRAFKDGVLWGGLGPDADSSSVLAAWARALKLDLAKIGGGNPVKEVAGAIALRRMLLVIDDAWDVASAKALKCGGPNCCYLLTTRDKNVSREFAQAAGTMAIGVLSDAESYQLLQKLAPEACDADPQGARRLVVAMGGLPQGITLLGGYLAAPDNSLFVDLSAEAMRDMSDPKRRLQLAAARLGSSGETTTLESIIGLSLDRLTQGAVDAFHALGAFVPKPEWYPRDAAEFVAEAPLRTLAQLAARNLVDVNTSASHLTMHQTLSDVARTKLSSRAISRHQQFYLGIVQTDPHDRWRIADNYPQIRRALESLPEEPVLLEWLEALEPFQFAHHLDAERSDWTQRALAMTSRIPLRREEGVLRANLAVLRHKLRRLDDAIAEGLRAFSLLDETKDRPLVGRVLHNLGFSYMAQGRNADALDCLLRAVSILKETQDVLALATGFTAVAALYRSAGDELKALLFDGQANLTDLSLPLPQSLGEEVDLALDTKMEQVFAEPTVLSLLDAFVKKDQAFPGFDGSLIVAIRKEHSEEWRCWHAAFEAATPPHTEISGGPRYDADCFLLLSERDADSLIRNAALSPLATVHGDRRVLQKFVERYLRGSQQKAEPASPRDRAQRFQIIGTGLSQSGQLELAIDNLTHAIDAWSGLVNSSDASSEDITNLAESLRQRAKAFNETERSPQALADLDRAIALEGLSESGGNPERLASLALSVSQRALLMAFAGRLGEAAGEWESALAFRQRAPGFATNDDLRGRQAADHTQRGMFLALGGRPSDAVEDFDHAIEIYDQLVQRGQDHLRKGLAISLQKGADAYRRAGHLEKAISAYDRAIDLRGELTEQEVGELYKGRAFARVTAGQLRSHSPISTNPWRCSPGCKKGTRRASAHSPTHSFGDRMCTPRVKLWIEP